MRAINNFMEGLLRDSPEADAGVQCTRRAVSRGKTYQILPCRAARQKRTRSARRLLAAYS